MFTYFYSFIMNQEYHLWDENKNHNIEILAIEAEKKKDTDNAKILLDSLPRSIYSYEFSIEKVSCCLFEKQLYSSEFN